VARRTTRGRRLTRGVERSVGGAPGSSPRSPPASNLRRGGVRRSTRAARPSSRGGRQDDERKSSTERRGLNRRRCGKARRGLRLRSTCDDRRPEALLSRRREVAGSRTRGESRLTRRGSIRRRRVGTAGRGLRLRTTCDDGKSRGQPALLSRRREAAGRRRRLQRGPGTTWNRQGRGSAPVRRPCWRRRGCGFRSSRRRDRPC
jgi:hypothetical protein